MNLPTDPREREGGLRFSPDDVDYAVSATLSLPLDREVERLSLKSAVIRKQRAERDYEQARDEVVISVRSALRQVELARLNLQLAEQAVEINRERLRGQELKIDTIDPQSVVDSRDDLLAAENDRDQALTGLRNSILNYLLASDQLRVSRDGTLERLPGMTP